MKRNYGFLNFGFLMLTAFAVLFINLTGLGVERKIVYTFGYGGRVTSLDAKMNPIKDSLGYSGREALFLLDFSFLAMGVLCVMLSGKTSNGSSTDLQFSSFFTAVRDGGEDVIKSCLEEKGIDANKKNSEGLTALMIATQNGHIDIVKYLLEKGADVNIVSENGMTPLECALEWHDFEIAKLFMEKGSDVNAKRYHGSQSILMFASEEGCTETVKFLLENGADVNMRTTKGATALMIASRNGHTEVVKLLKEHGAKE